LPIKIRKLVSHVEETREERGQALERPHRIALVAAVIENPFPAEYTQDLVSLADPFATELGQLIGPATVELLGDEVEAFGKGAVVGIDGEVEEGSALIHNLLFGNFFRDASGGTELLPAAEKVALPGATVDLALKHKTNAKTRSHHQTFTFSIADAPRPREIVVITVAANQGRPLARLAAFGSELGGQSK
jgi:hypothetical protein